MPLNKIAHYDMRVVSFTLESIIYQASYYTDPVATAHNLIVLSREELTIKSPFGINETLDTL